MHLSERQIINIIDQINNILAINIFELNIKQLKDENNFYIKELNWKILAWKKCVPNYILLRVNI